MLDDAGTTTPEEMLASLDADLAALVEAGEMDPTEAADMRAWLGSPSVEAA